MKLLVDNRPHTMAPWVQPERFDGWREWEYEYRYAYVRWEQQLGVIELACMTVFEGTQYWYEYSSTLYRTSTACSRDCTEYGYEYAVRVTYGIRVLYERVQVLEYRTSVLCSYF